MPEARLYRLVGPFQPIAVKLYETTGRVGPGGELTLTDLPFSSGDEVKVRIESVADLPIARTPFVFGLHAGLVTVHEDFDAPLPDSFWLGEGEIRA